MTVPTTPFVVGQWVRGEKFYGRSAQIREILEGHRNWLWLLGTRRVGKTSLLKQIEHITAASPQHGFFPLFWDFQGAEDPDELLMDFNDALLDAEERLAAIGIGIEDVESDELFASLSRLRRALRSRNLKLLLLCDEVEELIKLNENHPSFLRKLRRAFQSREDIRSVLASTIRLWRLAEQTGDTSPFLHGFTPPLYIHALEREEARALVRQANSPDEFAGFSERATDLILGRCDYHPYLIQLVCKRYLEDRDIGADPEDSQIEKLEDAVDQVANDDMVSYFFSVDYELLSDLERKIVRIVSESSPTGSDSLQNHLLADSAAVASSLQRLEHLGFIRRNSERNFALSNYFFRHWIKNSGRLASASSGASSAALTLDGVGLAPVPSGVAGSEAETQILGVALSARFGRDLFDNRYRLLEQVGSGASAAVFKAHDTVLKADIAIKLLRPDYASNEAVVGRFRQEILFSRDLGHPNIARIYHFGDFDGKKYFTMQWIEGTDLGDALETQGAFEEKRLLRIALKVASALGAAHSRKILHRDLKPQNVLLDKDEEPYVTDFGLARLLGQSGMTHSGVFLGTPFYASPEQARLEVLDERSDLYSLGLIVFEMATGRRPFDAQDTEEVLEFHRSVEPPDPRDIQPGVSDALSQLILRCLQKDRNRRVPNARKLGEEIEALLKQ